MDKLVHHVILYTWVDVNKALKEFKKKRNSVFYLEVEEIAEGFRVKVFNRGLEQPAKNL